VSEQEGSSSSAGPPAPDELLRAVIESALDFAIFATDPRGVVISWNSGAERLTGHTTEEMVGADGDVIFTSEDRAQGAPDRERKRALAAGRAEDERWHRRKDGSLFWGSGLMMPLRSGAPGFVKVVRDHTAQHRAHQALRASEARFRLLTTSIPQLVFRARCTGERIWGSPQWTVFTGLSDEESHGLDWLEAIHPDDQVATIVAWGDARDSGEYYVEHRIRAADGEYRWHQTRARPIQEGDFDADWVGTSADIHDLRGLQERQQVLVAELQHRTRNLLAIVQALARRTLRNSRSVEDFSTEFLGRLQALSRVQGLLTASNEEMIDLWRLVDLRQPSGHLAIRWWLEGDFAHPDVVLDWRETGVAIAGAPVRRGYGAELIERALPYQLKATTALRFEPDGVHCTITLPISPEKEASSA